MPVALSPKVFNFLEQLNDHNNREWFTENKNLYTESQENIVKFLEDLIKEMSGFDPRLEKTDPKRHYSEFTATLAFQKTKHRIKLISEPLSEWEKEARRAGITCTWNLANLLLPEECICRNPPY